MSSGLILLESSLAKHASLPRLKHVGAFIVVAGGIVARWVNPAIVLQSCARLVLLLDLVAVFLSGKGGRACSTQTRRRRHDFDSQATQGMQLVRSQRAAALSMAWRLCTVDKDAKEWPVSYGSL